MKRWEFDRSDSLRDLLGRLNRIRREQPALQSNRFLAFHHIESDQLLAYTKRTADGGNIVLTVVNLDPQHPHSGWLELPVDELHLGGNYQVVDLLTDKLFQWQGGKAYIELDPHVQPAHVFLIRGAAGR